MYFMAQNSVIFIACAFCQIVILQLLTKMYIIVAESTKNKETDWIPSTFFANLSVGRSSPHHNKRNTSIDASARIKSSGRAYYGKKIDGDGFDYSEYLDHADDYSAVAFNSNELPYLDTPDSSHFHEMHQQESLSSSNSFMTSSSSGAIGSILSNVQSYPHPSISNDDPYSGPQYLPPSSSSSQHLPAPLSSSQYLPPTSSSSHYILSPLPLPQFVPAVSSVSQYLPPAPSSSQFLPAPSSSSQYLPSSQHFEVSGPNIYGDYFPENVAGNNTGINFKPITETNTKKLLFLQSSKCANSIEVERTRNIEVRVAFNYGTDTEVGVCILMLYGTTPSNTLAISMEAKSPTSGMISPDTDIWLRTTVRVFAVHTGNIELIDISSNFGANSSALILTKSNVVILSLYVDRLLDFFLNIATYRATNC